jgi:hypothetical protein
MTDDPLRRLVAIKILKREYVSNPKVLHRTRDEARLLSKLDHPSIVRVEKLIEVAGRPILVMELVQGVSLKATLETHPRGIPPSVAMEVVRQTCVALHVAYNEALGEDGATLRVIHRDIKPSNALLSIHGQVKVVDFGIATGQFSEREAHTESVVMGSRPYMAPERMDGAADTPAVDIYSAGMSLYELLTGRVMSLSVNPRHHGRALNELLDALRLDGLSGAQTEELRQILRRMCAYDPSDRPSAKAVAEDLARVLEGMDPAHHVSLEEFARKVVEPMYERATRKPLAEALHELEDSELVTSAFGVMGRTPRRPVLRVDKAPAIFLGAVAGLVLGLGGIASSKFLRQTREAARVAAAPEMAKVFAWFPSDARAMVGSNVLAAPGKIDVPPGRTTLELDFEDGRVVACTFEAATGTAVRHVIDRGVDAITVDDGDAVACESVREANVDLATAP